MISYILACIVGIAVIGADQFSKHIIVSKFAVGDGGKFIPKLIDILYVENDGGAWGMLSGYTWLLVSLTIVIMLVCVALLLKYGLKNKIMFWAIILVLSGGLGNMIDRIFKGGKVVDFLHFTFWKDLFRHDFPVFNVADCAIVIGAGLLIVYFIDGMIKESRRKKVNAAKLAEQINGNEGN